MEKSAFVQNMFSSIAPRYDLLNCILSAGRDRYWRRVAVAEFPLDREGTLLDVASGTGDIAIAIIRNARTPGLKVLGVDFSEKMLELGREKVEKLGMASRIELREGDATALSLPDNYFLGAVTAFGLRNFAEMEKGLKEMLRVVKPGGKVVILEFTTPQNPILKKLYHLYFRHILPRIGGLVSGNRDAYQYLPDSVMEFPSPARLKEIMEICGMRNVRCRLLTFGIVALHVGEKV